MPLPCSTASAVRRDEMRLRRIINTPKRSIGDRSVEVAAQIGQQTGETLFEVVSHAKDYPALSRAANKMTLNEKLFSK